MKLNDTLNPELVEDEIGDFESTEAEVSQDDPAFIFELLSKRLYSNPEGSIVREITSNCFDAHTAAGKLNEPVPIKLYREEGQYWLAFKDEGTGMTPSIIKNVYMKYLKSTKRHSNAFIGAYGLGSKSPLSYTDFFYLTTRVDGIEWQYMLHKTQKAPRLELLVQMETSEPNGTIVKVPIRDEDLPKFKAEALRQLFYFDNVYVEGIQYFDNHYTVYDYKTFKYRPMSNYTEEWYKEMHIIVDKVTYPIDWNALKMPAIKVSVGVKFEIGDLDIPPNRETVSYTAESIALIKKRIEEVRTELTQIANNDRSKICATIGDYNTKVEQLNKHNLLTVLMNDENIKLVIGRNQSTPQTPFFISRLAPFRWKPLAHLPISFKENPFFEYQIPKQIGELGTMKTMKNNMAASYLLTPNGRKLIFLETGEQPGRIKNYQLGSGTYFVTRSKRVYRHKGKNDSENTFWDQVTLEGVKNAKNTPFVDGFNKSFLMREYRRIIAEELKRYCPNYKDVVVTEQTKISYRSHFDHKVKREKGIIPGLFAAPGNAKYDKDSRVEIDTTEIEKYAGVLIFGTKEQFAQLRDVAGIFGKRGGYAMDFDSNPDSYIFAASEKSTNKFLKPLQKVKKTIFSYEQICRGECEAFNVLVARNVFASKINSKMIIPPRYLTSYYLEKVTFFNSDVRNSLKSLSNFKDDWDQAPTIDLLFSRDQITVMLAKSKPFKEQADLEKCINFFQDLRFLWGNNNIELDRDNSYVKDTIEYLKYKGKPLNACHTIVLTDEEIAWRTELKTKNTLQAVDFRKTAPPRLVDFLTSDPYLKNFII